jgi:molecular chaperone HscB
LKCWNCQTERHGKPFCPSCGRINPPVPCATHYDVFGLEPTYEVCVPELERQYRELSMRLHPDRFAQAEPRERRMSLEQTSALNEGIKVLRDPFRRAFYLLRLRGMDLESDDASARFRMPPEFLEEMLELREELEEARERGDLGRVAQLAERVGKERKQSLSEALGALRTMEGSPGDEAARQKAAHTLGHVRYLSRFLDEVAAIEEEALR